MTEQRAPAPAPRDRPEDQPAVDSPDTVPGYMGFSPRPNPKLIATYPLHEGAALAVSRGLDRDRVVDETGDQTVVFGRRGSRPFRLNEMLAFYHHGATGDVYRVSDEVNGNPLSFTPLEAAEVPEIPPATGRIFPRGE